MAHWLIRLLVIAFALLFQPRAVLTIHSLHSNQHSCNSCSSIHAKPPRNHSKMVSPLTTDGRHRRNNNSNNRVAQLGTRRISLRPTNGVLAAQLFRSPFPNQPLRSGPKPLLGPRKQSKCIQVLMEQGRKHLEEPRRQQHLNELLDDLIEESSPSQPLLPQKRQLDSFNLCATGVVKTLGTPWGGKVGQRLWVSPTSDRSVRRRTNPSTTTVVMTRATTTTTTTTGRASTLDTTSFQQNARTMDDRAAASSTASSLSSPLGTSKQPAQRRPALDEDDSVASSSEKVCSLLCFWLMNPLRLL